MLALEIIAECFVGIFFTVWGCCAVIAELDARTHANKMEYERAVNERVTGRR